MITHWHGDHPQGVSAIRDAYPKVRIISTRGTEAGMRGPACLRHRLQPDAKFDRAMPTRRDEQGRLPKLLDDPTTPADPQGADQEGARPVRSMTRDFVGSYFVPPTETFEQSLVINDRDVPVHMMFLGRANTDGDASPGCPSRRSSRAATSSFRLTRSGSAAIPKSWIAPSSKLKALGFTTLIRPGETNARTPAISIA